MFLVLRKGFLILLAILVVGLALTIALGADALFGRALRAWGPYAFGGQPVAFAKTELAIFGGRATVDGFRAGTEADPLFELARGELDVGIGAALAGKVFIENAELTGARLHLVVREDGTLTVDPGPPPPEVRAERPPPPRDAPLPKPENRDALQILAEYWERYRTYSDYYDQYGGIFGGGESGPKEPGPEPARFPGKPAFVAAAQERARAERAQEGAFYLERAAIEDFRWITLDRRSGKAMLPEVSGFTFALERVGAAPDGLTEPATVRGEGAFAAGGTLRFRLDLSRTAEDSTLELEALGLPVDAFAELAKQSLPFRVAGGELDLKSAGLRFAADRLAGTVRVDLRGAKVAAKKNSPQVLGVEPQEFCRLLNQALASGPVAFSIVLGGTPTRPTFDVENEMDVGELLGGAVKAEAQRRAGELLDEQKERLKDKAREKLGDKVGAEAGGLLEGVLGEKPKPPEKPR